MCFQINRLIFLNLFINLLLFFGVIIVFTLNIFAQTYHDCTSTQSFNKLLEDNTNSEDMIDIMEFEFSKSLSKFDKCIDQDYTDINNKEDVNKLENSKIEKNSGKENAEQQEKEENPGGEIAEQQEKEESPGGEIVEQQEKEESPGGEIAEQQERSKNVNNDYNEFSSKNNNQESSNNKNTNYDKTVNSVASSELSGSENNKENEEVSRFEDNISEDSTEYENDLKPEKEKVNYGKIPDDIPQDDNDSLLEEQIRLAAMSEKDPEKKKRLWNEYRKYKGLPEKE